MEEKTYRYIAVDGPFSCGKRQLAELIADALNAEKLFDDIENPFLEPFYRNVPGSAFQAQLFFLLNRQQLMQNLNQPSLFHEAKVSDFLLEKDRIYAYLNLSDSELMLYEKLYQTLALEEATPDVVVYMQITPETVKANLKKLKNRGGYGLYTISDKYIAELIEAYNTFFFSHYKAAPVIVLNANNLNFEYDKQSFQEFLTILNKTFLGLTYFTPYKSS
ncbi:MAG: deoxynucleoside kinase [Acidobacteria bacterium]|nr:MAG: deoxynucleoside kinase [Acidobacteriota bacterium]